MRELKTVLRDLLHATDALEKSFSQSGADVINLPALPLRGQRRWLEPDKPGPVALDIMKPAQLSAQLRDDALELAKLWSEHCSSGGAKMLALMFGPDPL